MFFKPEIFSIADLFKSFSHLTVEDDLRIMIRIYSIYKQISKTKESFDQFYFWGKMIASDFDDIDKYLVSAKDIFETIKNINEIESVFNYLSSAQVEAIKQINQ